MRRHLPLLLAALALSGCSLLASLGSTPADLTVASYNIRHGRGMDNRVALERTAAVLRTLDADIVGIQEVDSMVNRSGRTDQAALLGGLLGMEHAFGAFMDHDGGRYGLAILSRHPIVRARSIALPAGQEPRVALLATIALPSGDTIHAVNVHFDWVENDGARYRQARQLGNVLDTLGAPWFLVGDFNDVPDSRTLRLFDDLVHPSRKPIDASDTYPSPAPEREIDYVFAARNGAWRPYDVRVVADSVASDHRPVVVMFRP